MDKKFNFFNLHIYENDIEIMVFRALSADTIDDMLLSFVPNGKRHDFVIVPFEEDLKV